MSDDKPNGRNPKGQFKPGSGGRPAGARNALQADFVRALAADFKENGEGVIRIVRAEKPAEYLKIVASILPKEFLLSENVMDAMSDEDLVDALSIIRKARGGEPERTH